MFPQNSIKRGLLEVSLEMLNIFLLIEGTSSMSFSVMILCVVEWFEALNVRKTCPI